MWLFMNAGLLLQVYYFVPEEQATLTYVGTLFLLSASVTFAASATAMRAAMWTSQIKRLAVIWLATMILVMPVVAWQVGREKIGDTLFQIVAMLFVAYAVAMLIEARKVWMNVELG
jgi:hypothetical protein